MKMYKLVYNFEENILNMREYRSTSASEIVNKIKELNLKYYDIDFYNSSFLDHYINIMTRKDLTITINRAFFKATFKKLL